jgi:MFS family permease
VKKNISRLKDTSTFAALRNPIYRRLWFASVLSGICVAAHDCAATWTMYELSPSAMFLSLMSTVASLPIFLFTLPAGALADIVDRRKLVSVMNLWLAAAAGLLALLASLRMLNPYIVLACVFLIGVGFAFNAPAWIAIMPEVVSDEQLPSAVTLSGLQLNISGIIGPALGGLLLPLIGANWVFAMNAVCFLIVMLAILQWKQEKGPSKLPVESFFESLFTAVRYVSYTPGIQVVLARTVLFAFFIALIPALIPVIGLKELKLTASGCGMLFSSMGAGSVAGAIFVVPWIRARLSSNVLTVIANLMIAVVYLLMTLVRDQTIFMIIAALAGLGWTLSASELWVAAQRAMPSWARGRINATVIMSAQGAMALGGIVWGAAAATLGVNYALLAGASLLFLSMIFAIPLTINFTQNLEIDRASAKGFAHQLVYVPRPQDGPVAITYEFEVDLASEREFLELMRYLRLIHLRTGAFSWRLHEDLTRVKVFRIEMLVPSWTQYMLQLQRMTNAEKNIIEQAKSLHVGQTPIQERIFLCINKELHAYRR